MRTHADFLNGLPRPMATVARDIDRFTETRRAELGDVNDNHWRRGAGTFHACCSEKRFEDWHKHGLGSRTFTVARIATGLVAQLTVSSVDGVLAGYAAGILLVVGKKEACREILAQHYFPVLTALLVAQIAAQVGLMVGLGLWLMS